MGYKYKEENFDLVSRGSVVIIVIDKISATTPPSLFGMLRKMDQANKKYHSG